MASSTSYLEEIAPEPEAHPNPVLTTQALGLSSTLTLSPPNLEKAFWTSPYFRSTAWVIDITWTLLASVANGLHAWWLLLLPHSHPLLLAHCCCLLAAAAAQLACLFGQSQVIYYRWRNAWLLLNRGLRISFTLATLSILREALTRADSAGALALLTPPHSYSLGDSRLLMPPPSQQAPHSPPAPLQPPSSSIWAPIWGTLHNAMRVSGSGSAFLHAMVAMLPLRQQAMAQAAHLAMLLGYQLGPACHLMQQVADLATAKALCQSLNAVVDTAALALMGGSPGKAQLDQRCEEGRAAVLLVLLLNIFLAFMLPLYITYKVEQWQKLAFLEHVRFQLDPDAELPERSVVLAVLYELLILFLMAGQAWVLALVAIKHLPPSLFVAQHVPAT